MSESETKTRPNSLYESDFFTWTQEQARLLRERRFDDLDLDNLVDEVESVGSSEKREIRSRLVILIGHLLKWKFQPGGRGSSWSDTIFEQREHITDIVTNSPNHPSIPRSSVACGESDGHCHRRFSRGMPVQRERSARFGIFSRGSCV